MVSFQEMVERLQAFWSAHGCTVVPSYDVEMGAGTYHPDIVFGVMEKNPLSIAFLQPSRRPSDGRYGENPNRLQRHLQYEVLLKPSPSDAQALVVQSFCALGLDFTRHDLRFVEDNWESPTLGAGGVGWEVWLDGMECLQMTYFQQFGGAPCQPVPLELAYGLERLALVVQGKDNVFDLIWNGTTTYRDLFHRQEAEHSAFNLEECDVEGASEALHKALTEGTRLAQKNLKLPAYDRFLHANHLFNLLEARGVLSVAQRTVHMQALRALANSVLSVGVFTNLDRRSVS